MPDKSDAVLKWTPTVLAVLVTVAFVGLLFMLLVRGIPEANKSAFDIVLGLLGGAVTAILNYYFGSSLSSAKKDDTIGAALNAASPAVPSTSTTVTTTTQP